MTDKTDKSGTDSGHVRKVSATERLRALLDERGVEYTTEDNQIVRYTDWGRWFFAEPLGAEPNTLGAQCELVCIPVTPEQAIAATLGRGTCHFEQIPEALYDDIECSECGVALWGFQMDIAGEGCPTKPRYCPNCGREVVNDQ